MYAIIKQYKYRSPCSFKRNEHNFAIELRLDIAAGNRAYIELSLGKFLSCVYVRAPAHLRAPMTHKLCAVGM